MYVPNADTKNYPLCRLQLVAETYEHEPTNSIKFPKFEANEYENGIIKLWGLFSPRDITG